MPSTTLKSIKFDSVTLSPAVAAGEFNVDSVFPQALEALQCSDPIEKAQACQRLWQSITDQAITIGPLKHTCAPSQPGRPVKPEMVPPGQVPRRRLGSPEGRAALIHAIAHIEFNAINLALDATLRFADMPAAFYHDWLSVAADEAKHFLLLAERLQQLGYQYGDFSAHNGLWEMAEKTAHDALVRMALVPRVLEARGLDVTPGMIQRLQSVGDNETVAILKIILHEEERHVEVGSLWFRYCCEQRDLEPDSTFQQLLEQYYQGQIKLPLNEPARRRALFSDAEISMLQAVANSR